MDTDQFDAFYTASYSRLVHQLQAMIGDHEEAADCVQEAFARAWSRRASIDEDRGEWLSGVVLCGASYSPADPAVDSASVLAVGDDRATGRHLRLYEDDTTAVTVALDFVAVAEGCPQFEIDGGASQGRNEVSVIDIGSRSRTWLVRQTYTGEEPGQNLLVVSQTGNTVLVAFRDPARSPANGSTGTAEEVTAFTTELERHVVPRLECTFVTRDC